MEYSHFEYCHYFLPDVGEDLLAMCEQNVALNKHLMEPGGKCCTNSTWAIACL